MLELLTAGPFSWLELEVLFKLILASVLGGTVGAEREVRGKAAGFRTNVLIAVGATLFTEVSLAAAHFGGDPARIAAQVVSGCGFLGAGAVIQGRGSVTGLTTAASIWVVAAIGVAVGAGAYVAATGGTVFVLITLASLGRVEARLTRRPRFRGLTVETSDSAERMRHIITTVETLTPQAELHRADRDPRHHAVSMMFRIRANDEGARDVVRALAMDPHVHAVYES